MYCSTFYSFQDLVFWLVQQFEEKYLSNSEKMENHMFYENVEGIFKMSIKYPVEFSLK